jgi:SET domain-containing protein
MTPLETDILPIEVRNSTIHGSGAFATRALAVEDPIGRYTGKVYSPSEVSERDWDHALTFVFGLSDGSVIDGALGGNATRHINHSCSPNCAAFETETDTGELSIVIEALRPIEVGDELFLDYSLDPGTDSQEDFACHCGSSQCRGTLVAVAAKP